MLLNSKLKDGSLKNLHVKYTKYMLGKILLFSEIKIYVSLLSLSLTDM